MLTPEQISAIRDQAGQITDPIIEYLLRDIARRISDAGQLTASASYQIELAQQMGLARKEIKKELKRLLKVSESELKTLLTQSAEVGYRFDLDRFGVEAVPFEENAVLQQIVEASVALATKDFKNITQTLGMVDPYGRAMPLQDAYRKSMDFALEKVATGATDLNTAVRDATKNLAKYGIRTIDYQSGVHRSLEAAVRGCIMGGLGLMQEQISQKNHDDMGADGWEISAHAASAPDHEPIQGRQYSDAGYTALNNSLVRRIGTLNCGHAAFPIILGVNEPQYTEEQLEEFRRKNKEGITYQGKHYTMYEATQTQRKLERSMRTTKRKILLDEELKDDEHLLYDQIRLRRLNEEYVRFSRAADLPLLRERTNILSERNSAKERSGAYGIGTPNADLKYINSDEYRRKFDGITKDKMLNQEIFKRCKAAVIHQSGDYFEDLAIISETGEFVGSTSGKKRLETFYSTTLKQKIKEYPDYSLIAIHNHGTNVPPSGADFGSAGFRKYKFGVIACHNGEVYVYDIRRAKPFTAKMFDDTVDKYRKKHYNEEAAYKEALKAFEADYGIEWRQLS